MRKQREEGRYNCTLTATIELIFVQVVQRGISHIDYWTVWLQAELKGYTCRLNVGHRMIKPLYLPSKGIQHHCTSLFAYLTLGALSVCDTPFLCFTAIIETLVEKLCKQ